MSTENILAFLSDVRDNNSLEWMHAHEPQKKQAQADFLDFVQACIDDLSALDPSLAHLEAKDLVFRINRDTRFSQNKAPYNPVFRAHISQAGRMPIPVGYFISIAPGSSFAGGGLFAPNFKDATKMVRNAIAEQPEAFLAIVEDDAFKRRFSFVGMPLKRVPQGFDAENPAAEYLKCKCWAVEEAVPDDVVADGDALRARLLESFRAMRPFNEFLNRALEGFEFPKR
ncbi:DUF2461 domain-containing protein [Raoultibacter phocaeensis]|uniref:DUF2461 domain-containing protein n=1 Tax=Raoultibacter phocaeensis TaxID=2479841 RepID=UPI0011199B3B|nr:DUF2461 domain-containing protein [Raoultibacter phocaeensis]